MVICLPAPAGTADPLVLEMGRATRWLRSLLGVKKENSAAATAAAATGGGGARDKKRWSFGKSGREPGEAAGRIRATTPEEAAWLRNVYEESEKEQSKHAIAVAAATAAAADAAVAAAQAAVAVVRLTSQGRGSMLGVQERIAAVKIQTVFRAYLAKKALRALRALVKLQALVRGYLVRKKASQTLYSMQALIRAQASARAQRSRSSDRRLQHPEFRPRISHERFDDSRSEQQHSQRLSSSIDSSYGFDRSPKIVEVDTCRPKSRSSRRSSPDIGDDLQTVPISSPLAPITIPDCHIDYDWCLPVNRCVGRLASTAQSTPRCYITSGNGPPTPAKSVAAGDGLFRRFMPNCPNYMVNTQSFEAKVRSQSAPKQRPESAGGPRKRIPLREMLVESRASLSAVGMERSCNKGGEAFNFKNAVVSRIDRSLELCREADKDFYLQRKW